MAIATARKNIAKLPQGSGRGPGRPRKSDNAGTTTAASGMSRGRGRPPASGSGVTAQAPAQRGRGRPPGSRASAVTKPAARGRGRPSKDASATATPAVRGRGRPRGSSSTTTTTTAPRGRGRPPKDASSTTPAVRGRGRPRGSSSTAVPTSVTRGRGRPPKDASSTTPAVRGRGRPRGSTSAANTASATRSRGGPRKDAGAVAKPAARGRGRPRGTGSSTGAVRGVSGSGRGRGRGRPPGRAGVAGRPRGSSTSKVTTATSASEVREPNKVAGVEMVYIIVHKHKPDSRHNETEYSRPYDSVEEANDHAVKMFREEHVDFIHRPEELEEEAEGLEGFVDGEPDVDNQAFARKDEHGCLQLAGIEGRDGEEVSVKVRRKAASEGVPFGGVTGDLYNGQDRHMEAESGSEVRSSLIDPDGAFVA